MPSRDFSRQHRLRVLLVMRRWTLCIDFGVKRMLELRERGISDNGGLCDLLGVLAGHLLCGWGQHMHELLDGCIPAELWWI